MYGYGRSRGPPPPRPPPPGMRMRIPPLYPGPPAYPPRGGYPPPPARRAIYPPPRHYYPVHADPRYGPPPRMLPPRLMPRPPMGFGPPRNGASFDHEDHDDDAEMSDEQENELQELPVEISHYSSRPQPFDLYMCDKEFHPQPPNEEKFAKMLLLRNQQITPSDNEQSAINSLISRVKGALETISASDSLSSVKLDEFREVGSFKKGTMLTRKNAADLVVFFKTLPTPETVKVFADKIVELLKSGENRKEVFGVIPREFGCEIAGTQAILRILVAISADQTSRLDPGLHLKADVIQRNLAALRHSIWFDEHAGQPAIKILVRLIKDIKSRCSGFAPLDVWTIELLCHYCVTCTPDREPLSLTHAFRRFFQLVSSGFLLHSSIGVADPTEQSRRINYGFSLPEADLICRTGQFITRLIMHERFDRLLGAKNMHKDVALGNEIDTNLNIAPLKEAYNKELMVNAPPELHFYSRMAV